MSDFDDTDFDDMNGFDDMMNSMPKEPFYKNALGGIAESAKEIIEDNLPAVADTFGSTGNILDDINEQVEKVKGTLAPLEEIAKGIREGGKAAMDEFKQTHDIKTAIDAYKQKSQEVQRDIERAEAEENRNNAEREKAYKEQQQQAAVTAKLGFDMTSSLSLLSDKITAGNDQMGAFVNLSIANSDNIASSTASVNSKDRQRNSNSQIMAMVQFHTESLREAKRTNALLETNLRFDTEIVAPAIYAGAKHELKLEASQQDLIDLQKDTTTHLLTSIEMANRQFNSGGLKGAFEQGGSTYKDVSEFMTYDGGLDISKIGSRVLDNVKPTLDMMMMLPQMMGDRNMRKMMGSSISPVKSLAKQIPKLLLSAKAKDKMTKTNRSVAGLGPLLLSKLDSKARDGNMIAAGLQRMIGLDAAPKSHARLGQRNVPVPFDMITRKSIVDVIPEHLSGIESALTGLPQRMMDHKSGKMSTKDQMQEQFQTRIDRMGTSPFYDIKSAIDDKYQEYDPERNDDYNKLFSQMLKSGRNYNPRNITNEDRKEFVKVLGGKDQEGGRVDSFIRDLKGLEDHTANQFLYALSAGRSEMHKDFTELEQEITEYGGGEAIAGINNRNEIDYLKRKIRSADVDGLSKDGRLSIQKSNLDIQEQIERLELSSQAPIDPRANLTDVDMHATSSPITKIYDLLTKGIIVFPDNRYNPDDDESGIKVPLPRHLQDIQKRTKNKLDARQKSAETKHKVNLERKSKIAEAEAEYRREETKSDTRFMGFEGAGNSIEGLRDKLSFNNLIIKGMEKIDQLMNDALYGKREESVSSTGSKVNIPFVLDDNAPEFMEGPQVDLSNKTKKLAFSNDGPQGLIGKMSVWSISLMEKMNHALLGDDYDPLKNKSIHSSFQDLQKNLHDKLFGDKKNGKAGLLQKVTSPLRAKAEDLRHRFMSKIGNELAHTMRGAKVNLEHATKDVSNRIKDASLGLFEKVKTKATEWKESQKAKGDETTTSKIFNALSKKAKIVGGYGEAAKDMFGEYTEKSIRRRVARGQVSQEEYEKWMEEKNTVHTKEDARHEAALGDIEKSKSAINLDVANSKNENFGKELSDTEERVKSSFDSVKGMSSEDHKADRERAKKQASVNEDILKKGGTLTKEQQDSAMTNREKLDSSRKELNTKLTEEMKRQETDRDKDAIERDVEQTEHQSKTKEAVVNISEMLSGAKESIMSRVKPTDNRSSVDESVLDPPEDNIPDNRSSVDESVLDPPEDNIPDNTPDNRSETVKDMYARVKEFMKNNKGATFKDAMNSVKSNVSASVDEAPNFTFGFKDKRTFDRTAARAKRLGISPDLINKVATGVLPLSELQKAVQDKIKGPNAFDTHKDDEDVGIDGDGTKFKKKARAKLDEGVNKAKDFGKSIFNKFKEGSYADEQHDNEREGKNKIFDMIAKNTARSAKVAGFMFKTMGKLAGFILSGKLGDGMKKGLGGIGKVLKTLAIPAGLALGAVPLLTKVFGAKQGSNVIKDISKGNVDGVLQGVFGGNTSGFDADGNELTGVNEVASRVNLAGLIHRGQKTANKIGQVGKNILGKSKLGQAMITKGDKAVALATRGINVVKATKVGKLATNVIDKGKYMVKKAKVLTRVKGAKAVTAVKSAGKNIVKKVSGSKLMVKIKDILTNALSKGKLGKLIGKSKNSVIAGIMKGMKTGGAKILGKLAKALVSPAFLIASIVADIGTGMADVHQIFELDASFDPPVSMRLASGIAKAVSNQLTFGFVPVRFLADIIYNAVGSDEGKAKLAQAQADLDQKANALGVDKKRLNALENKSTMTKIGDIFRSKKSEEKRDAKLMGMDVDEFRTWKKKKDAYGKDDPNTQAEEQKSLYAADAARKDGTVEQNQAKGGLTALADGGEVTSYGQYTGIYDEFYTMIKEVEGLASPEDITRLSMLIDSIKNDEGSEAAKQFYKEFELVKAKIAMTASSKDWTTRVQGPNNTEQPTDKIESSGLMNNKPGITRSESKRVEQNLHEAALIDKLSNMEKMIDPANTNPIDNGADDITSNANTNAMMITEALAVSNELLGKLLGNSDNSNKLIESEYQEKRTKERLHSLNIATGGEGKGGGLFAGIKAFFSPNDDIDVISAGKSPTI